jgi:hypothetical protein
MQHGESSPSSLTSVALDSVRAFVDHSGSYPHELK